jgi:hypothetical protein
MQQNEPPKLSTGRRIFHSLLETGAAILGGCFSSYAAIGSSITKPGMNALLQLACRYWLYLSSSKYCRKDLTDNKDKRP